MTTLRATAGEARGRRGAVAALIPLLWLGCGQAAQPGASPPPPGQQPAAHATASTAPTSVQLDKIAACEDTSEGNLDWLVGCWSGSEEGNTTNERWQRADDGSLQGVNETLRGSERVHGEQIRIHRDGHGYHYVASPEGQATTTFSAAQVGRNCANFDNPEHDFPQRVGYRLQPDGSLLAFIAGTREGKQRTASWHWQAVTCPAAGAQP